jgi:hypothetical protein
MHNDCLIAWIVRQGQQANCPLCRRDLTSKNIMSYMLHRQQQEMKLSVAQTDALNRVIVQKQKLQFIVVSTSELELQPTEHHSRRMTHLACGFGVGLIVFILNCAHIYYYALKT